MSGKPFSIQAPESIAKEYGGNKQRIAQAVQSGLVDPTAAVLAGMFIDRMRSAQMQEQVPNQTVAQQVMAPPAPPMAPSAAPPGMAMGGYVNYAGGGLDALDVPEYMFGEPDNGGYAGGGIVAFASAGEVREERKRQLRAQMRVAPTTAEYNALRAQLESMEKRGPSRADLEARDNELVESMLGRGLAATANAPAAAPRALDFSPGWMVKEAGGRFERAPRALDFSPGWMVKEAGGRFEHAPPAPSPPRQPASGLGALAAPQAAALGPTTPEEYMEMYRRMSGGDAAQPYRDRQMKMLEETLSPEAERKSKDEAKWLALTQLGASLAASKSPYFLQAVGEATQAALPGLAVSKKERRTEINQALQAAAANEGLTRQEQRDYAKAGLDLFSQNEERRLKIQELLDNKEYRQAALEFQKYEANLQHLDRMAGVRAQLAVGMRPTDTQFLAAFQKRDPEGFKEFMAVRYGSTAEAGIPGFPQVGGSTQRPTSGAAPVTDW